MRASPRWATAFVLLVWSGMLVWVQRLIVEYAPLFPIMDDRSAWRTVLPPFGRLTWRNLWIPHNEHRIPLPRFITYCLYELTGDLRPGLFLQAAILGLVSLGMILLARRLRGRTSFADAIFPLLWLHTGNAWNLMSGFQLALTLPTAFVCAILVTAAASPARPRAWRALACAVSLASLPLCGGAGISQVPALGAWVAWTGWRGRRSADPAKRRGSRILLSSVLACAAFAAIHAWGYSLSSGRVYGSSPWNAVSMGSALLALGFGPEAQTLGSASAWIVLGIYVATLARLGIGLGQDVRERGRRLGILASIAATSCLVAAIVGSRSGTPWQSGFPLQYVTLTTPFLCSAFLAWELYGNPLAQRLAPTALALAALAMLPGNARIGGEQARRVRGRVEGFEQSIARGAGPAEIFEGYQREFHGDPWLVLTILRQLAAEHKPPFDDGRAVPPITFDFPTFGRAPSRVESDRPVSVPFADRAPLTVVSAGTRIHLELRADDSKVSGRFGIPDAFVGREGFGDVRVLLELVDGDGRPQTLLDRRLEPGSVASDRGLQAFTLALPPHGTGEIVLRTESLVEGGTVQSSCGWTDVVVE